MRLSKLILARKVFASTLGAATPILQVTSNGTPPPTEPVLFWFEAPGYETLRDVRLLADGTEHDIRLKRDRPQ